MYVDIQTLWLPKSGHTNDEYEDAFAFGDAGAIPLRAAVADGATESAFSGGWARTLADAYVAEGDLVQAAASARRQFDPPSDGRWYVQAKAAEGAHAALLGFELDESRWRAEAIGDCCLLQVRSGVRLTSWPFADPTEFHHRPHLLSSREGSNAPASAPAQNAPASGPAQDAPASGPARDAPASGHAQNAPASGRASIAPASTDGTWEAGDLFVLATDALAAWLLGDGLQPLLHLVAEKHGQPGFSRFVEGGREEGLRNDDVTALIIQTSPSAK